MDTVRKIDWNSGNGLTFDGVNDYIDCNFSTPSWDIDTPFSIGLSYTPIQKIAGQNDVIFSNRRYISLNSHGIMIALGQFSTGVYTIYLLHIDERTYRYSGVNINYPLQLNTTYYIIFTKSNTIGNSGYIGYILGDSKYSDYSLFTNPLINTSDTKSEYNWTINRYVPGDPSSGICSVNDIKLFNKCLTPEEARYLYNKQGQIIPASAISNVVVDYRFEDKQGTILKDISPNNYNGTLTGFTNTTLGASNQWVDKYGRALSYV